MWNFHSCWLMRLPCDVFCWVGGQLDRAGCVFAHARQVGLGGWSRLFTWTGSDPSQEPVLFISHYDVVPVANGTEQDWEHPPFGGVIADGWVQGFSAAHHTRPAHNTSGFMHGVPLQDIRMQV